MQAHVDLYILIYLHVWLFTAVFPTLCLTSEAETWPIHSSFPIENKTPIKRILINERISTVL